MILSRTRNDIIRARAMSAPENGLYGHGQEKSEKLCHFEYKYLS